MNWIKKIATSIILLLSLNLDGQNQMTIQSSNYNKWIESNPTCPGCGSFFTMIVDEKTQAKNGYYYFYVYLWSNSYYGNTYAASSYVKNIEIFFINADGLEMSVINFTYALIPPKSNYFNGWFQLAYLYNTHPNQTIRIKWSEVKVW